MCVVSCPLNLHTHVVLLLSTRRGSTAVAVLGVYYVLPLSTVATVLKDRDSSSLYWPLSLMNVINGCLWFAYGLAITDFFILLPK